MTWHVSYPHVRMSVLVCSVSVNLLTSVLKQRSRQPRHGSKGFLLPVLPCFRVSTNTLFFPFFTFFSSLFSSFFNLCSLLPFLSAHSFVLFLLTPPCYSPSCCFCQGRTNGLQLIFFVTCHRCEGYLPEGEGWHGHGQKIARRKRCLVYNSTDEWCCGDFW